MELQSVCLPLIFSGLPLFLECESISGGINLDIAQAPFMLSLRRNGEHVCGAAVISPDWGITAAHCFPLPKAAFTVRSGSVQRDSGGMLHDVTERFTHPKYAKNSQDYDIAVFRVDPPFEMSETTAAIELPPKTSVELRTRWASIAGWGAVPTQEDDNDATSKNLKYALVPRIPDDICAENYKAVHALTPRQICYGYQEGGADTCKGDSGGPLYNTDNILIGITSWGDTCGEKYTPGVYMDITLVMDWIHNVTGIR
ncbi:trypsin 3A1 isoform X2 [Diachasma alloeum]|uniref:trypsin 3A1 isoform X2 n=1 Tax=Diachasma alloeum TaxID=454923 RepID=UPI00073814DE|nr:trypsin 3A1 isoform X2 [Diachasma alloeum]